MRVTYLHQYFATPQGATGTRSYEFARRLVDRGHTVTMIASDAHVPELRGRGHGVIDGITLRLVPVAYTNTMSYARRLASFGEFAGRSALIAARVPADVIIASSTPLTIALPGMAARLARRAPMVFEVRDLWPTMPIAVGALRNPVAISAGRGLEWLAYHAARHVIALSPGMADGVAARGYPRERITVITNGCDLDRFPAEAEEGARVRSSIPGLGRDDPLVVYAGSLGRLNDVAYLADIAAEVRPRLERARFLIVGDGWGRQALLERARQRGVLDQTLFVWPPVPKSEMPALLSAATIATSLFQPIPEMAVNSANKFFDALAAGRPVLINYGGWQAEILAAAGAGISVPPADAAAAADALVGFLGDRHRLADAGRAAQALARDSFSRDALAERFMRVVETAAKAPG